MGLYIGPYISVCGSWELKFKNFAAIQSSLLQSRNHWRCVQRCGTLDLDFAGRRELKAAQIWLYSRAVQVHTSCSAWEFHGNFDNGHALCFEIPSRLGTYIIPTSKVVVFIDPQEKSEAQESAYKSAEVRAGSQMIAHYVKKVASCRWTHHLQDATCCIGSDVEPRLSPWTILAFELDHRSISMIANDEDCHSKFQNWS